MKKRIPAKNFEIYSDVRIYEREMITINSVSLIGNIGNDIDLRHTQSGKAVCSFNLAVKDYNKTVWITIVAWDKTAEAIAQYCNKGSKVGVTGRIDVRDWTDRDGNKRKAFEVVASNFDFCEKRESRDYGDSMPGEFEELDDDGELPF